jgi:hypothetical protein
MVEVLMNPFLLSMAEKFLTTDKRARETLIYSDIVA